MSVFDLQASHEACRLPADAMHWMWQILISDEKGQADAVQAGAIGGNAVVH
ncbi:hypothetical protein [Noviherbaspirillum malthae]|uniref:hypothetical protein n=1 Tax=Noviherbaspirillum malthae TaxID=1260987 RepID=UPI001E3A1282|nr:hypothetical protein [Noviherbaspirillum malthae]